MRRNSAAICIEDLSAPAYSDLQQQVRALEPELWTGHFDPVQGKELIRTCLDCTYPSKV